jgi:hypothetical protein
MTEVCILVFAGINQINACKEKVSHIDESAEYLANFLASWEILFA